MSTTDAASITVRARPPAHGLLKSMIHAAMGLVDGDGDDSSASSGRSVSVGPLRTAPDATGASLFQIEPSLLERAVVQAANDLKVTGFGQRTRAALRRNRSAESNSVLPYSMYKDVVGPDLVRHLNALTLLLNSGQHVENPHSKPDRELFAALRDQLAIAKMLVALMWTESPSDHARAFVDYDNVPIPFCPMYPDARDLIGSYPEPLPRPLSKISDRLRNAVQDTPIMREAQECFSSLTSRDLRDLKHRAEDFKSQSRYRQGETLLEWQTRVHLLVVAAQAGLPHAIPLSNSLIHSTISSVVSLAVWDHELASSEVISAEPWGENALQSEPQEDHLDADHLDESRPYGPDIPDGFSLSLTPNPELMLLPIESSVRLIQEGTSRGVAIVKGASISWSQGEDMEVGLTTVRLSAYEPSMTDRGYS